MSGTNGNKKELTTLQWTLLLGAGGSFLAAFVGGVGPWVADSVLPEKVVLQYRFSEQRVGKLSSWHLQLKNSTEFAFEVDLSPPPDKVIQHSFSKEGSGQSLWSGELTRGEAVDVLLVVDNATVTSGQHLVPELVKVTYEDRNAVTGKREKRVASVEEASLVQNSRGLARTILIGLPFILYGLYALRLWWLQRKGDTDVDEATNASNPK